MKKISILLLITLITTTASAQMRSNSEIGKLKINWYKTGWFLDGNAGVRFIGQTSDAATMNVGPSFNAGLGYFFNDKIGIKGRLDYDEFTTVYGGSEDRAASGGASLEVMVRLLQVFNHKRSRDFSLNLHAGSGLSMLVNPNKAGFRDMKYVDKLDYSWENKDRMGHIIIGLTPQYHINSRLSINLDVSHFTQFKQNYTYDTGSNVRAKDVTGFVTTTVGLTIRP